MGRSKASTWIFGTAFLCVVLMLGAWFLFISPKFTAASDTREQADQVAAQNDILEAETAVLREQFANLEEYRAELAGLQTQIPTQADLANLIRTIEELAEDAEVTSISVGAGDAATLVPAEPTEVPEAASDEETDAADGADADGDDAAEEGDGETTEPEPEPVPTGPAAIDGFVSIPLTIGVLGSAPDVQEFIGLLQTSVDRLVLVESLNGTAMTETDASGGRPETEIGDIEMIVTAYAYVLADVQPADVVDPDAAEAEEAPALPQPSSGDNPFAPNVRDGAGGSTEDGSTED